MKRILLSCVTCLLALGLVTACNDDVIEEEPNEPEVSDTGNDGGTDGGTSGSQNPGDTGLLGSFDFSTNEKDGTLISSSSDLDSFWTGEEGLYRGVSAYDTVYLGNGTGGAFADETACLKFGTGSANGTLQLKFAPGTCITGVAVTAHSWYKVSEEYPEQEPNQLVVNGESQDCSVSGTATELTYTITGDLINYVTFETVGRVTIHSIDVYGTYEPETIEKASVTLSAENAEIMAGATTEVSLTWETSILYGADDFEWKSDAEAVATVEGGVVTGVGEGKANISATLIGNENVTGSTEITVTVATAKVLTYSYTFNSGDLGTNSSGSTQGERGTEAGTSDSLGGLVWRYSATLYKGWSDAKGIQIGAGNEKEAQTTDPFTLSTDFGETVKLDSIILELGTASSGGGKYSITLDSNAVATDVAFKTADVTEYRHSGLSYEGEKLTISLLSTTEKAMYIHGISLTIEVGFDSTLSFE